MNPDGEAGSERTTPQISWYRLPIVPGLPDPDTMLARAVWCAVDAAAFRHLPADEVKAGLGSLAEGITRARYHELRFEDCVAAAVRRKDLLGGPVVGDWHAVPPIIYEAAAFLGAVRMAVDVLVYMAARRSGKSVEVAESWDSGKAIAPSNRPGEMPPTKYDVPEVLVLRKWRSWFEELNLYRNAVYHRGLGGDHFGYYSRADSPREASSPTFNAMLVPDLASLRDRLRPHQWTYMEGRRLDELVATIASEFTGAMTEIVTGIWDQPFPHPGTEPRESQPNSLLSIATPVLLQGAKKNVLPVFTTKAAARASTFYGEKKGLELRPVRPTKVDTEQPVFLLAPVPSGSQKVCEVQIYDMKEGKLTQLASTVFDPVDEQGDPGLVRLFAGARSVLYVWQPAPTG